MIFSHTLVYICIVYLLYYVNKLQEKKISKSGEMLKMGGGATIRVGVKYSTCTWYLYLSTYLSVLDVLEYLVYGNVKVLVLVLVLDHKVLGT